MNKDIIVKLEDGADIELSYHPDHTDGQMGYWVDIEKFYQSGWSFLSKKDLEIVLDKINELEGE